MGESFLDAGILDIVWFLVKVLIAVGIVAGIAFLLIWIYSFFWVSSFEKKFFEATEDSVQNLTGLSNKEMQDIKKIQTMSKIERILLWLTVLFLVYKNSVAVTEEDVHFIATAESMDTLSDLGYKDFKYDFLHLNPDPTMKAEYGADYLVDQIFGLHETQDEVERLKYYFNQKIENVRSDLEDRLYEIEDKLGIQ